MVGLVTGILWHARVLQYSGIMEGGLLSPLHAIPSALVSYVRHLDADVLNSRNPKGIVRFSDGKKKKKCKYTRVEHNAN